MTNPLLRHIKNLYFYISIWIFISSIHSLLLNYNQNIIWRWSVLDSVVFNFIYSALGLSFWYTCKYIPLEKNSLIKIVVSHAFAAVFSSVIWVSLSYHTITKLLTTEESYQVFLQGSLTWRSLLGSLFYFIIISFYYIYIYSMNFKEQLLKQAELQTLIKEAELKSLKFQINPHFLFNSLNSINSLTISSPQKAGEMTVKLGDYLRYTLSKNEKQETRLKEELDSAKLYLEIEKIRFADKFKYIEEIQNNCNEIPVPNMILQPLFENAIKHGVYESVEKVTIKFLCRKHGDYLKITVENNFAPETFSKKGEGIGLENIQRRLEMIYNQRNLLNVEKESNIFRVILYIPLPAR